MINNTNKRIMLFGALFFVWSFFVHAGDVVAAVNINWPETEAGGWVINQVAATEKFSWQLELVGPIYEFSYAFSGIAPLAASSSPARVELGYEKSAYDKNWKRLYFFNNGINKWQALGNSEDVPSQRQIKADLTGNMMVGKLAVLARPDVLVSGTASWYKYKGGNFAASPDFKIGSVIRVYNTKNNKFVDVTINDYGPNRDKHPDRVVDLDREAFKKIASLSDGLISIRIVPLKYSLYQDDPREITVVANSQEPAINAKKAAIVREKDGAVLWTKDGDQTAPLASLTKIIAAKIFLDTKPNLSKVVSYKKQDEKYNYQYCKPGEAAQLKVKDGETMTLNDLLYSALVGSANNAVESLVRLSGLSRPEFIKRMNDWAQTVGATSTHLEEPTGLSPNNVSSPQDYAIIVKEAFKNPQLQKISTTWRYQFKTKNTKKAHTITNTNKLLDLNKYKIVGSKTGYLDEAGHCLMTRVAAPGGNLIIVNFNSTSSALSRKDNETLINYALRIFK